MEPDPEPTSPDPPTLGAMSAPPEPTTMEDVLHSMGKDVFPEGAMCTGWVIVSEWMDAEGDFWTYVGRDDRNPPWRHHGLMSWALEGGECGPRDRDDDDDDDG